MDSPFFLLLNIPFDLSVVINYFLSLELHTPQQILKSLLLLPCEQLVNLSLLFVDLLDGVNGMITIAMRPSLLNAKTAQVLLTSKAIDRKPLVMIFAHRQSIYFVDLLKLVALQDLRAVMVNVTALAEIKLLCSTIEDCLLILTTRTSIFSRIELPLLPNCKVCLVSQMVLLVRPEKEIILE